MFQIIIYSIVIFYTLSGNDHQYPQAWNELQSNEGWELIKETDRIKVFSKEISASPLPAHRAEIISSLNMEPLIRTAWQVEKSPGIFLNAFIVDAGIYKRNGNLEYTAFQVLDIPFMVPRLYQFHSVRIGNNIHWARKDSLDESFNPDDILLPPVNFGSWQVEKYGDKSKLTYRLCTDPGGGVPLWIVELFNKRYLPQMLLDLENYASRDCE